jgi:transcriptional regulator with XRE-family HTH domain
MNSNQSRILVLRHELKRLLKKRELTAAELSRKTGVSKQVLSDWMAGVMPRNLVHLKVVADFLGVGVDLLCFGVLATKHRNGKHNWLSGTFEGRIRVIADD